MNRRDFLRRSAILAAGAVAVDQLEILERLTHSKVFALGGWHQRPSNVTVNRRAKCDNLHNFHDIQMALDSRDAIGGMVSLATDYYEVPHTLYVRGCTHFAGNGSTLRLVGDGPFIRVESGVTRVSITDQYWDKYKIAPAFKHHAFLSVATPKPILLS